MQRGSNSQRRLLIIITVAATAGVMGCDTEVVVGTRDGCSSGLFATTLSAGEDHSCAINLAGELWCWGKNEDLQLGNENVEPHTIPVPVNGMPPIERIACGDDHSCAVAEDASLWCWGENEFGQLGRGTTTLAEAEPTEVAAGARWRDVAAQGDFTCAVREEGTLWCWGRNDDGQLGTDDTTERDTATQVGAATDWLSVSTGVTHSCGLRAGGDVYCWGTNSYGELGLGDTTARLTPTAIGHQASDVAPGFGTTCMVAQAGSLWCWGRNHAGQLGLGDLMSRPSPTQVGAQASWTQLAVNNDSGCGLAAGGTLWCWGDPHIGGIESTTPVELEGSWLVLDLHEHHTCLIDADRQVWCAGDNSYARLGTGDFEDTDQPTPVCVTPLP